jgi:hypothetical protein
MKKLAQISSAKLSVSVLRVRKSSENKKAHPFLEYV